MLLIRCPYCEMERPEIEFRYAGEAHIARAPQPTEVNDADWTAYLYLRTNPKGVHFERWRHNSGCARFFNAVRHTVSDKFLAVYKAGEPRPEFDALIAEVDPGNRVQGSEDVGALAAGGEEA